MVRHNSALFGPLFILLGPTGLSLGYRSIPKIMFGPTNTACQLLFWKYSTIFSFLIQPQLVLFLLGPDLLFLGPGSSFKTLLRSTHIDCQIWFWKYNPIFWITILAHFGPFWPFLGPAWLFLGLRWSSKTFLRPPYWDCQFWFLKYIFVDLAC